MKLKGYVKYIFPIAILAIMAFAFQPMPVIAEEGDDATTEGTEGEGDTDSEGPTLNNAAQVAKAENVAAAATAVAEAEAEAAIAQADEAWAEAKSLYESGTEEYTEAEEAYNTAIAEATEALAGVSVDGITALREAGMGWGEICHQVGIHPSILGQGHYKNKHSEMAGAMVRNMKTGLAKGHGVNANNGNATGAGLGLGRAEGKKGKGMGANGKGNNGGGQGNGKSNAGGNGKSNAGGNGKGIHRFLRIISKTA
ncbi:MAG: hypothetical protein JRJ39_16600 [Deltaproteobacteria bacterium]|nr:hypothetical protein [Deltaproteobacteria bacterium]